MGVAPLPPSSGMNNYTLLNTMDTSGDGKITGSEVKFLAELSKLSNPPGSAEIEDCLKNMKAMGDPSEKVNSAVNLAVALTMKSADGKISKEDLEKIIQVFKDDPKLKQFLPDIMKRFEAVLKPIDKNDLSKGFEVDKSNFRARDLATRLEKGMDVAKQVVDNGGKDIKGVDDAVAESVFGKAKTKGEFDPKKIDFSMVENKKLNDEVKGITISFKRNMFAGNDGLNDKATDFKAPAPSDSSASEDLKVKKKFEKMKGEINDTKSQVDGKETSFEDFAKDKKIFNKDGDFISSKDAFNAIQKFVDGIKDPKEKLAFVSKFMTANFVHSGSTIEQTGVTDSNFSDALKLLPKDDVTGRKVIDCNFYVALSQKLLSGDIGGGKDKSGTMKTEAAFIKLDVENGSGDDKTTKPMGGHAISVITDTSDPKNPKFFIQSNNQMLEVSKDELKAAGWKEESGPPTAEQVIQASSKLKTQFGEGNPNTLGHIKVTYLSSPDNNNPLDEAPDIKKGQNLDISSTPVDTPNIPKDKTYRVTETLPNSMFKAEAESGEKIFGMQDNEGGLKGNIMFPTDFKAKLFDITGKSGTNSGTVKLSSIGYSPEANAYNAKGKIEMEDGTSKNISVDQIHFKKENGQLARILSYQVGEGKDAKYYVQSGKDTLTSVTKAEYDKVQIKDKETLSALGLY